MRSKTSVHSSLPILLLAALVTSLSGQDKKPNILVIFGDDIGQTNVSAYTMGLMGYRTPNIDRIAKEGMIFTDYYAEQSCTAGPVVVHHRPVHVPHRAVARSASRRDGRAPEGGPDDRRAAQEPRLRHRPVRQEPPRRPERVPADGPRVRRVLRQPLPPQRRGGAGAADVPAATRSSRRCSAPAACCRCKATDKDDPTEQPRWGRVGKQTIEDTGPLTKKRMETIDDETSDAAVDYIKRQAKAGKPFFCWYNSTRMHSAPTSQADRRSPPGLTARTEYADGMVEHDGHVGKLLKALDDARDRRQHDRPLHDRQRPAHEHLAGRGHDPVPQREEHQLGGRVPRAVHDPLAGQDQGRAVSNEIVSGHDWLQTFLAAAGEPDVKEKLLKGHEAAGKTFKVHLDGYNQLPYLTGEVEKSPRRGFFYFNDDGDSSPSGSRTGRSCSWSSGRRARLRVWAEPFTPLRVPKLFDLRADPYERADITSNTYYEWFISNSPTSSSPPRR